MRGDEGFGQAIVCYERVSVEEQMSKLRIS